MQHFQGATFHFRKFSLYAKNAFKIHYGRVFLAAENASKNHQGFSQGFCSWRVGSGGGQPPPSPCSLTEGFGLQNVGKSSGTPEIYCAVTVIMWTLPRAALPHLNKGILSLESWGGACAQQTHVPIWLAPRSKEYVSP